MTGEASFSLRTGGPGGNRAYAWMATLREYGEEDEMAAKRITAYVVSHTHWDREWYWPFQWFRHLLVETIDEIIDVLEKDPDFACFHLDGQTIILEDYLEIRPQQEGR